MISKKLWDSNQDIVKKCLNHEFIKGISKGTLNLESFKNYVAQDTFFLKSFSRAYSLALLKSDSLRNIKIFQNLIESVNNELELHNSYSKKLGIDLNNVHPMPACKKYTDFLIEIADGKGIGEIFAAMTPCVALYSYLGKEVKKVEITKKNQYYEWIAKYSSKDMGDLSDEMQNFLDEFAEDNEVIAEIYRKAMEFELEFFSDSLTH